MFSISLNGRLVGYFQGPRGVKQEHPLSPYLFAIAMNVLSRLLDVAAKYKVFDYHPKCKKIGLTHLCFVDDLLIFAKGNKDSILRIKKVLQVFYSYFGLQLNCEKREQFTSGSRREEMQGIQQATGFKRGLLLVRYLGVPLVTRRLTEKDCAPLLEKITTKISGYILCYQNVLLKRSISCVQASSGKEKRAMQKELRSIGKQCAILNLEEGED
ncbi:uncharacterized protein LOC111284388 [Durio zibethinus]|uniref:Uncharacterized protein LOC111284388 n=1 Tax=Durio zibethinus TaxID=66656 RepID=A0A6P5XKX8_DURZI|nr:uncharacterized protein LOC111284388 [Durio zibethinus]